MKLDTKLIKYDKLDVDCNPSADIHLTELEFLVYCLLCL